MSFAADLLTLANDFWEWRSSTQPVAGDDIPRLERPSSWAPDWSLAAVAARRGRLQDYERTWRKLGTDARGAAIADQVDYRLVGSALERVRWELNTLRNWQRNPMFYVHQTLGAIFEALLAPPPFHAQRSADLVVRAESIPGTLAAARENLVEHAVQPFAYSAIAALQDVTPRLVRVGREVSPWLTKDAAARLQSALMRAAAELESFAEWLSARAGSMPTRTAPGRAAYVHFLRRVALV
ncbi:MAG: DUF885 family protein, partial [Chloroflexi bacterium]|nr:DUF885 family protein [Chloroflexota bacterium]